MSREDERQLSTADLAAAGDRQDEATMAAREAAAPGERATMQDRREELPALFLGPVADDFRRHWEEIQISFVDDPRRAVQRADELVAQVMKSLADSFAQQRSQIESEIGTDGRGDTESLRVGLQRYRSFFQRLLSV